MSLNQEISKVYIASDHAGFVLKQFITESLTERGYTVEDLGAYSFSPEDDYPDFITPCAQRVAQENTSDSAAASVLGIIIGGSGQGEAMAANRVKGARAAVFYGGAHAVGAVETEGTVATDTFDIVRLARLHNDANILSLGARFLSKEESLQAASLFLETEFSHLPRHIRRLKKF